PPPRSPLFPYTTLFRSLGLGDEYLRLYRDRLAAVTALQARAAATRLYRRGALTIVVVGDGAKLYDRLRGIAPIRIVDVDGKSLRSEEHTSELQSLRHLV